jgi:putative flippase GtrA
VVNSADEMAAERQPLRSRLLWFGVGAVLNYILIATLYKWVSGWHWPAWVASACSVGVATSFLFAWNVLVNFRSERKAKTALPRYVAAVVFMWICSSAVLTLLKRIDMNLASSLGGIQLDFDVIGMQCFLAVLKFTIYHKWVFPSSRTDFDVPR